MIGAALGAPGHRGPGSLPEAAEGVTRGLRPCHPGEWDSAASSAQGPLAQKDLGASTGRCADLVRTADSARGSRQGRPRFMGLPGRWSAGRLAFCAHLGHRTPLLWPPGGRGGQAALCDLGTRRGDSVLCPWPQAALPHAKGDGAGSQGSREPCQVLTSRAGGWTAFCQGRHTGRRPHGGTWAHAAGRATCHQPSPCPLPAEHRPVCLARGLAVTLVTCWGFVTNGATCT